MEDGEPMALSPYSARWWPGLGLSECCGFMVEVLQAHDGSVIISRCHHCKRGIFEEAECVDHESEPVAS